MAWAKREYSKAQIDKAGKALVALAPDDPAREESISVIDNWRACHGFPLWFTARSLEQRAKNIFPGATVARRIKRLPSIKTKLEQHPGRLSQMQDVGGCRAIMDNASLVARLANKYEANPGAKLILHRKDDYIKNPKLDGYRGIHLIMKYDGDEPYKGQQIEIQIRTRAQHAWATTLETTQAFRGEAFKSKIKTGSPLWLRYFVLTSAAFADWENLPSDPNLAANAQERMNELNAIDEKERITKTLELWNMAINVQPNISQKEPDAFLFLLELNTNQQTLSVSTFPKTAIQKAEEDYGNREKATESIPGIQLVLVSVDSFEQLKSAYPNYYFDLSVFLSLMPLIRNFRDML